MHSRLPVPFWFYQWPKRSLLPRSCLFGFPGYQRGASKSLLRSIPEFPSCLRYRRSAPKDPSPSTLWACVDITVWYSARIFQSPANFNIMDTSPLASIVSQTPKINSKSVGNKTFLPYLQRLMYSVRDAIRTRDLPLRSFIYKHKAKKGAGFRATFFRAPDFALRQPVRIATSNRCI